MTFKLVCCAVGHEDVTIESTMKETRMLGQFEQESSVCNVTTSIVANCSVRFRSSCDLLAEPDYVRQARSPKPREKSVACLSKAVAGSLGMAREFQVGQKNAEPYTGHFANLPAS